MVPSSQSAMDPAAAAAYARTLGAPGAFYMTGEDALQISGWNITSAARLRASGRFLGCDGVIRSFEHDLPLTTDRVIASLTRQLGEGWLLNLTVRVTGATSVYGQTVARAQVVRGLETSGIVLATLCHGAVTSMQPIAFPNGRVLSMVEGPGAVRSVTGTDPAAGVEISETVPTGARWRLLSVSFALVTDATVATRIPAVVVDDGTNTYSRTDGGVGQTASLTRIFTAAGGGMFATNVGGQHHIPFSNRLLLLAGHRVRTVTSNLQAGDNYGAPQLLVEEWIEGA